MALSIDPAPKELLPLHCLTEIDGSLITGNVSTATFSRISPQALLACLLPASKLFESASYNEIPDLDQIIYVSTTKSFASLLQILLKQSNFAT